MGCVTQHRGPDEEGMHMNGEIYNFRKLRLELQAKGYYFKTGSDSQVSLYLYHAEGDHYAHQCQRLGATVEGVHPAIRLLANVDNPAQV
ncbi:MAG: hypothetical protein H7293_00630 [Candidatus Saccharibacteria bacterium]|nr:hypothetical protein [Rhodoferax sp.]